ncbi:MAG: hypothetical protein LBC02_01370 [Planctomycetaceae bacterium]|jgi:hypothetical protein|nr:hypothetical protein [Planctomycetaceae bacterium]
MIRAYQSNKEFIEAAGIAEHDAFIAVAIRRIVGKMLEIPARELVAELTFEAMMRRASIYTDWDALCLQRNLKSILISTSLVKCGENVRK